MKKRIKKICKKIFIIVSIFILFLLQTGKSEALSIAPVNLFTHGLCGELLTYKGEIVENYYVYYQTKSLFFPVYCIDKSKQGINGKIIYDIREKDYIKDVNLWRYITNGYPYKTKEQLGCETYKEAYLATQQAIYTYLYKYNLDDYEAIGEAGKRVLNALKQIVHDAKITNEKPVSSTVTIRATQKEFTIDPIDQNYASKTYEVIAEAPIVKYTAILSTDEERKELKVTDINNNEKFSFKQNEKFKILVPLEQMKQEKDFEIAINTDIESVAVIEGVPDNPIYQPYVMTAQRIETIRHIKKDKYEENQGSIKIIKQDQETKARIEGVEFSILDENKQPISVNLKTNSEGEILLEHLAPGEYYIQETKSKEGYMKKEDLVKVNVEYNQMVVITINNLKEAIPEVTTSKKNISTQTIKKIPEKRLPVTGK